MTFKMPEPTIYIFWSDDGQHIRLWTKDKARAERFAIENSRVKVTEYVPAAERDALRAAFDQANEALALIGDFAHARSTGPAVPDALWEVRTMAYDAVRIEIEHPQDAARKESE